jgi:hypothetical protein
LPIVGEEGAGHEKLVFWNGMKCDAEELPIPREEYLACVHVPPTPKYVALLQYVSIVKGALFPTSRDAPRVCGEGETTREET